MKKQAIVVTGLGAMGIACARRIGSGYRLLLVDNNPDRVGAAVEALVADGFAADGLVLDIADPMSISSLVERTREHGRLRALVHTAAVSQSLAPTADHIYDVNLIGTAHLLDALLPLSEPGTVGIVIASMGAQFISIPEDVERQLALGAADRLKAAVATLPDFDNKNKAYLIAKRGNQLRVEAEALTWAEHGARLVSISPGIISTAQGRLEMREHPVVEELVRECPAGRIGTPEDIASTVEWLISPQASFVTGVDIRVDGGTIAAQRWN